MVDRVVANAPIRRMRAQSTGYWILSIILGPLTLLWGFLVVSHPHSNDWQAAIASLFLWLFSLAAIRALRVDLYEDRLCYRNLFGRHEILYARIQKIQHQHVFYKGSSAPMLALYDNGCYSKKPLKIPIGGFPPRDVRFMEALLKDKTQ